MRKELKRLSILLLGSLAVLSCQEQQQQQQQQAPPAAQYAMISVSRGDCTYVNSSSATIRGRQDIEIMPQVAGTLTQLLVNEGDEVRKGETMFVIDQIPYKAAVTTAEAAVATAEASASTAELTFESKTKLYNEGVVSEFDYLTSKNALMVARAQLADAEARLVSAKNNLSYTTVKSPADGVIGVLPYRVGSLVSSALPQPLTTVSDNSVMYVYFSVSENELLDMVRTYGSREKAMESMPELSLKLSDGSMYEHTGKISSMSGVIDRQTGTITLRADFENPDGLLHSGASGNIVMPTQRDSVITIPQAATYEIQDKVFVFKNEGGVAKSAMVNVTHANGTNLYIVESGLNEGDVIVGEGVGLLREGTPIAAKGAAPAAPASVETTVEE